MVAALLPLPGLLGTDVARSAAAEAVDDHDGRPLGRAAAAVRREERADERQPVAGNEGQLGFRSAVGQGGSSSVPTGCGVIAPVPYPHGRAGGRAVGDAGRLHERG